MVQELLVIVLLVLCTVPANRIYGTGVLYQVPGRNSYGTVWYIYSYIQCTSI